MAESSSGWGRDSGHYTAVACPRPPADELHIGVFSGPHIGVFPDRIALYKANSESPCADLCTHDDRPRLRFFDGNSQERVSLYMEGDGIPWLSLSDGNSRTRATCYLTEDGVPHLELHDGNGQSRLALTIDEDDNIPEITLYDHQGEQLLDLTLDHEENPALRVRNAQGIRQPWLTHRKEG